MENSSPLQSHFNIVKSMMDKGTDVVTIEKELASKGLEQQLISELIQRGKKLQGAKRTRKGSLLVLAGVITLGIGFLSCLVVHYTGGEIGLPLYGVTILGLLIVFSGLIFIFN